MTGGSALTMKLELYDNKNKHICNIDNDNSLLGSYPIDDGMRIHVIDKFALVSFDSNDSTDRFRLSEEEYGKKGDTLRSFLQKNKLGKYNEEELQKMKEEQEKERQEEARLAAAVVVGSRCEVKVPKQATRRGTVKYNGTVQHTKGLWIGVQYDEPLGKNDGSVNDVRYFTCPPKYGGFVKPAYVTIGDFPEEHFDLEDEI